jgi:hypothetical protein
VKRYFAGVSQTSKLLFSLIFGLQQRGQKILVGFLYFRDLSASEVLQWFHLGLRLLWLLEFYVFFGVAAFDEKCTDSVAMVSLQHDLAVFGGSSAGAKTF